MNYQIEKGIPLPTREVVLPLKNMEVGDSFLVNDIKINSLRNRVSYISKGIGMKFTVIQGKEGTRVWRIS